MKKIRIILILLACIIVVIFSFLQNYSLKMLAYTMLMVIILFFVFGTFIQKSLNKIVRESIKNKNTPYIEQGSDLFEEELKQQIIDETSEK